MKSFLVLITVGIVLTLGFFAFLFLKKLPAETSPNSEVLPTGFSQER